MAMQGYLLPPVGSRCQAYGVANKMLTTFGDRLKFARERKGLTQSAVARHCGQETHQTVVNWEKGRNYPSFDNLVVAAELFGVSLDWLAWGEGMGRSVDIRIRAIPAVLRDALVVRLHEEIDKTEEAAKRLPPELTAAPIPDGDARLHRWTAPKKDANR